MTTVGIDVSGSGAVINTLLYERRLGPQSQVEIEAEESVSVGAGAPARVEFVFP